MIKINLWSLANIFLREAILFVKAEHPVSFLQVAEVFTDCFKVAYKKMQRISRICRQALCQVNHINLENVQNVGNISVLSRCAVS